jgi:hypothetical protein
LRGARPERRRTDHPAGVGEQGAPLLDGPTGGNGLDEPNAFPSSAGTHGIEHVYAGPGTYTVTATSLSTGCAGNDEQSVTVTGSATVRGRRAG